MPPTVLVTGVHGGHDLDLRRLEQRGVALLGTLRGVTGDTVHLADDAETILAAADTMCAETVRAIGAHAAAQGLDVPAPGPVSAAPPRPRPTTLSLRGSGIRTVIWSTGYAFDYDWVHAPVLDAAGRPVQTRGVAPVPGLYFLGLHWMHTFKSGTFLGIGEDADHVADHLVTHALRP
jgi:putative flavoprotein involved in K+ transport